MSKTETLRQRAAALNEKRIEQLASQIENVRQAELTRAEELAATLEPLAQAMAALIEETRQTLAEIEKQSKQQSEQFQNQIRETTRHYNEAAKQALKAANSLNMAGQRMEWRHYGMAALVGMTTALLVTACLLWLAPPKVENYLDAKGMAEYLQPALTEALKPSKSK